MAPTTTAQIYPARVERFGKSFISNHPNNPGSKMQNVYFTVHDGNPDDNTYKACLPLDQARMFEKGQDVGAIPSEYGIWKLVPGQKPLEVRQASKDKFSKPVLKANNTNTSSLQGTTPTTPFDQALRLRSQQFQKCLSEATAILDSNGIQAVEWPTELLSTAQALFSAIQLAGH